MFSINNLKYFARIWFINNQLNSAKPATEQICEEKSLFNILPFECLIYIFQNATSKEPHHLSLVNKAVRILTFGSINYQLSKTLRYLPFFDIKILYLSQQQSEFVRLTSKSDIPSNYPKSDLKVYLTGASEGMLANFTEDKRADFVDQVILLKLIFQSQNAKIYSLLSADMDQYSNRKVHDYITWANNLLQVGQNIIFNEEQQKIIQICAMSIIDFIITCESPPIWTFADKEYNCGNGSQVNDQFTRPKRSTDTPFDCTVRLAFYLMAKEVVKKLLEGRSKVADTNFFDVLFKCIYESRRSSLTPKTDHCIEMLLFLKELNIPLTNTNMANLLKGATPELHKDSRIFDCIIENLSVSEETIQALPPLFISKSKCDDFIKYVRQRLKDQI